MAVTGPGGRLGSAVVAELERREVETISWGRPEYDLDDSEAAARLVERDRPDIVIHCAAWVDVDGCALEPELAQRRNADATSELATAVAASDGRLALVSTNEVFDGGRTDGVGYVETDEPKPGNPYGFSKLAGERAAKDSLGINRLLVIRTAWLFGPGGSDFPRKILAAAAQSSGDPLRVVNDEIGSPTYTPALARSIGELALNGVSGLRHIVGQDVLSRYDWAVDLLRRRHLERSIVPVESSEFRRPSTPPPWGVLASSYATGNVLPGWFDVAEGYLAAL